MKYGGKGEAGDKGCKGFKGFKSFKDKSAPMEAKAAVKLPPGLARKPADHPGRVAWLKAHGGSAAEPKATKGKASSSSDLERRLDRLLSELEELRREIRKKK